MHLRKQVIHILAATAALGLYGVVSAGFAADDSTAPLNAQDATLAGDATFGGPTSTAAQIRSDEVSGAPGLRAYDSFKERLRKDYGLSFGVDYNLLYQHVSQSTGENDAAGGVLRFYGTWLLTGRDSGDSGSLVFKVENRHRAGTDVAPKELASEVGYASLTAITFSNAKSLLTNLYWHQSFADNRIGFVAGLVDVTDYVDVYGLVSPWTDFSNLAFSTDPSVPAPDQGLGGAVRWSMGAHYYGLAGIGDANGDPGDPLNGFDTFFNEREYFTHLELGWIGSWEDRIADNVHLTAWHVDRRTVAQVPDGRGMAFSYSRMIGERWLPFLRLGYGDGGGAPLERSASAGFGYFTDKRSDALGLGVNWGRPNREVYGPGLGDQTTVELYYRLQMLPHVAVTPDLQLLINPALNPTHDRIWVLGLRARLSL